MRRSRSSSRGRDRTKGTNDRGRSNGRHGDTDTSSSRMMRSRSRSSNKGRNRGRSKAREMIRDNLRKDARSRSRSRSGSRNDCRVHHPGTPEQELTTQSMRRHTSPSVLQIPRRISAAAKAASKNGKESSIDRPGKARAKIERTQNKFRDSKLAVKSYSISTSPLKSNLHDDNSLSKDEKMLADQEFHGQRSHETTDKERKQQRTSRVKEYPRPRSPVNSPVQTSSPVQEPDPIAQKKIEEELYALEEEKEERQKQAMEASRKRREAIRAKYKAKVSEQPEPVLAGGDASKSDGEAKQPAAVTETTGSNDCSPGERQRAPQKNLDSKASAVESTDREAQLREILLRKFMVKKMAEKEKEMAKVGEDSENSDFDEGAHDASNVPAVQPRVSDVTAAPAKPSVFDMFSDEVQAQTVTDGHKAASEAEEESEMAEMNVPVDNDDDEDGYYRLLNGEMLDNKRYKVTGRMGRGVFSTVVSAWDKEDEQDVAIKIIRSNEMMRRTGEKELNFLRLLRDSDPHGRKRCIKILHHFFHRGHLCLVFEAMEMNFRKLTQKYGGGGRGLALQAVRQYAKQLFIACKHMHGNGIVHADLKPDNIVVSKDYKTLKICDFGSAFHLREMSELKDTPLLVSRYYRAPEIILGNERGQPLDVWSIGCCLYEMFTGDILFKRNKDNNGLLYEIMKLCGPVSKKLQRSGTFTDDHFDSDGKFVYQHAKDPVTGKKVPKVINITKPVRDLAAHLLKKRRQERRDPSATDEHKRSLNNFKSLLQRCLMLDPNNRITAVQALKHPFLKSSGKHKS